MHPTIVLWLTLPVWLSVYVCDLTQLRVGLWGWCWWEQGDRGVALCQTWACCRLHGVLMGVDVILYPAVSNKRAAAHNLFVFQATARVLPFILSTLTAEAPSVGDGQSQHTINTDPLGAPGSTLETAQCDGNWAVLTMDTDTHNTVCLNH